MTDEERIEICKTCPTWTTRNHGSGTFDLILNKNGAWVRHNKKKDIWIRFSKCRTRICPFTKERQVDECSGISAVSTKDEFCRKVCRQYIIVLLEDDEVFCDMNGSLHHRSFKMTDEGVSRRLKNNNNVNETEFDVWELSNTCAACPFVLEREMLEQRL